MRIAFVTHQFFPAYYTGVERLTLNLATQLRRMGHACVVVSPAERSGQDEHAYTYEGTRVRPIAGGEAELARPWLQDPEVGARLGRVLDEEQVDLVHVMQPLRLPRIFSVAEGRGLPVVAHIPDFGLLCARIILRRRDGTLCEGADDGRACVSACGIAAGIERVAWGRSMLARAAEVVAPSRFAIDVFASQGFDTARWHEVPWGTDYALHSEHLPAPEADVLRIGFLGTLIDHKGPRVLVDAMRSLPGRRLELLLYGESFHESDYEASLRELAAGDERIIFPGSYDHRAFGDVLRPLDAVAIPSLWHENLTSVGLNAVASGVPLIASDVGGLRELIDRYECGFVFRPGDPAALAGLLEQLLLDPSILRGVRERMRYPPSLEEEAWQMERIYGHALTQRARPPEAAGAGWRAPLRRRMRRHDAATERWS